LSSTIFLSLIVRRVMRSGSCISTAA
jgi:hypothetical protein